MWSTFWNLLPWFITAILVNVIFDLRAISQMILIKHTRHAIYEGLAVAVFGILFAYLHPNAEVTAAILSLCLYPAIRWIVHDLALNIGRGVPFTYRGIDGQQDSLTDIILDRYVTQAWHYYAIKLAFLTACSIAAHYLYTL